METKTAWCKTKPAFVEHWRCYVLLVCEHSPQFSWLICPSSNAIWGQSLSITFPPSSILFPVVQYDGKLHLEYLQAQLLSCHRHQRKYQCRISLKRVGILHTLSTVHTTPLSSLPHMWQVYSEARFTLLFYWTLRGVSKPTIFSCIHFLCNLGSALHSFLFGILHRNLQWFIFLNKHFEFYIPICYSHVDDW